MRRIGSREAEELLTAGADASAYPGLSELLAAATAPPRPDELVGLRAAMAAFEAAGPADRPRVAVARGRGMFVRPVAVKVAAGVAAVLFGGTALAAETGRLPGSSQRHAHDLFSGLGVPPPGVRPTPAVTPAAPSATAPSPGPGPRSRRATSVPASTATPSPAGPAGAATRGLCRSWQARQEHPKKKPMPAEPFRRLAAAAGGAEHITAFCAALLTGGPGEPRTRESAGDSPTPTHPGKSEEKTKSKKKGNSKDKSEKGRHAAGRG